MYVCLGRCDRARVARPPAPTAPCKLCGTTAVLQWSHIIPRWTYRRLIASVPGGPQNPVQVSDDVAITSGEQDAEYMLCRPCEERIGPSEKYAASIALNEDGTFPAIDKTTVVPTPPDPEWKIGDASALDCDVIAYFVASVVWRASVSARFPKVSLGTKYDTAFADYLLGRTTFPSSARLMVELMQPGNLPRVDRMIVAPEGQRDDGFHVYQFCMFGMWFRLMVGNVLPDSIKPVSFVDTKLVLLSNGLRLLKEVSSKAKAATPKGSLARRKTH